MFFDTVSEAEKAVRLPCSNSLMRIAYFICIALLALVIFSKPGEIASWLPRSMVTEQSTKLPTQKQPTQSQSVQTQTHVVKDRVQRPVEEAPTVVENVPPDLDSIMDVGGFVIPSAGGIVPRGKVLMGLASIYMPADGLLDYGNALLELASKNMGPGLVVFVTPLAPCGTTLRVSPSATGFAPGDDHYLDSRYLFTSKDPKETATFAIRWCHEWYQQEKAARDAAKSIQENR